LPQVPDVAELKPTRARTRLADLGFQVMLVKGPITEERWNRVVGQVPAAGSRVLPGASVELTISQPPPIVPDVELSQLRPGSRRLRSQGYRVRTEYRFEDFWREGTILLQLGPHRALPGETIRLVVAKERACTPGYSPCLPPATDYDCAGGPGNGPEYTGTVQVRGPDIYELDEEGDGLGCE
jgi:beta-lactam-binding protein with PASTA domain